MSDQLLRRRVTGNSERKIAATASAPWGSEWRPMRKDEIAEGGQDVMLWRALHENPTGRISPHRIGARGLLAVLSS